MRRGAGILLFVICFAMPACGSDTRGLGSTETPAVVADPAGVYRVGKAEHPEATEWDEVEASADGRRVTVHFTGGVEGGWSLDSVTLRADDERVVLTLFGGYHAAPEGSDWPAIGVMYVITIAVPEPLRSRPIVDGAALS